MLAGGSAYKLIADLMRKAKAIRDLPAELEAALPKCKTLLTEAIEIKLKPYSSSPPNNGEDSNFTNSCVSADHAMLLKV